MKRWCVMNPPLDEAEEALNRLERDGLSVQHVAYDAASGTVVMLAHNSGDVCALEGCDKATHGRRYCSDAHRQKAYRERKGSDVLRARDKNRSRFGLSGAEAEKDPRFA